MANVTFNQESKIIMNRKPTVTIAISALNEEKNIGSFLKSVLTQKEEGFSIENIWIFSDGSTDKTVDISLAFKDKRVSVFEYRNREGKSSRLNIIYKKLTSDFLVQSDADVVFSHKYVIRDIIQPLINEKEVGMCGGNPLPVQGETFTERAINCTTEAFTPLRKSLRGGNNVFSVDGRILAYKKELVKKIFIPEYDVTANDAYTFFACLTLGYKYRFVESAIVFFRSPQTLKDQVKQNTRFLAMPIKMSKYFDPGLVRKEKSIPRLILVRQMLKIFVRHPVLCTYIYIVNLYCRLTVRIAEKKLTALWPTADTTKLINFKFAKLKG